MATRGCIAKWVGEGEWEGVYHHWDSYPTALGKTLWDLFHGRYEGNVDHMVRELIEETPQGWSTCNGDWSKGIGLARTEHEGPCRRRGRGAEHADREDG